jgi:alpha-tubulin suppressor-like RCC1 family protein
VTDDGYVHLFGLPSAAAARTDKVTALGRNTDIAAGKRPRNTERQAPLVLRPGGGEAAGSVACGESHVAILATVVGQDAKGPIYGSLFTVGAGEGLGQHHLAADHPAHFCAVPTKVRSLPRCLRLVACGAHHTVAVDAGGGVWAWGAGATGSLGLGDPETASGSSLGPRQVGGGGLADEAVTSVSCGANHTVVATARGFAFAWGWGEHGRLGLGDDEPRYSCGYS